MNFLNKIGIGVSIISLIAIGGSLYYYNETISKNSQVVVETKKEKKSEEKIDSHNIKVDTKVEDNILVLTVENVSGRELTDVFLEIGLKGTKITDIYIEKFAEGKKTIKVPMTNVSTTPTIKDNNTVVNEFRLLENYVFKVGEDDGYVIATSIKRESKDFYKEKIKNSDISNENKEKVLKALDSDFDYQKLENYLKKVGIIKAVTLSDDTVKFNADENELVIEAKTNTTDAANTNTESQAQNTDNNVNAQPVAPVQPAAPALVQPEPVQPTPAPVQPAPVAPAVEQPVQPVAPAGGE